MLDRQKEKQLARNKNVTTTRKIATETEIRIYNRERETVAGSERG